MGLQHFHWKTWNNGAFFSFIALHSLCIEGFYIFTFASRCIPNFALAYRKRERDGPSSLLARMVYPIAFSGNSQIHGLPGVITPGHGGTLYLWHYRTTYEEGNSVYDLLARG
ncbi:hypothetical protein BJY04DRAFT_168757 [Aspergillus karnatakaensis]|uniref:uncharacterized protein n=1 Tax=Aspergillus karnatakaensis TaxID=1810916 RepID=UPI003CCCBB07